MSLLAYAKRSYSYIKHSRHQSTDLLVSLVAFSLLITMSLSVRAGEVPSWEITSFEFINGWPGYFFYILWPFMQYGVFVTIPILAGVAFFYKKYRLATLLLIGGIGIYYAARLVKEYVPRGRPGDILPTIQARENFAPWSSGCQSYLESYH